MIRSLMKVLGGSSERVAPSRRAALGVESLDGRVMPSAMIVDPPPREGEEIPTVTRRGSTEEITQLTASPQERVSRDVPKGGMEELPQSDRGEVTLYLSNGSLQEIPSFM